MKISKLGATAALLVSVVAGAIIGGGSIATANVSHATHVVTAPKSHAPVRPYLKPQAAVNPNAGCMTSQALRQSNVAVKAIQQRIVRHENNVQPNAGGGSDQYAEAQVFYDTCTDTYEYLCLRTDPANPYGQWLDCTSDGFATYWEGRLHKNVSLTVNTGLASTLSGVQYYNSDPSTPTSPPIQHNDLWNGGKIHTVARNDCLHSAVGACPANRHDLLLNDAFLELELTSDN